MEKKKLLKILNNKITIGIICFFIGAALVSNPTSTTKLQEEKSDLESSYQLKLSEKDTKISELEAKIESAKPWFEMKEEERKAEEERLAQEKAEKEAAKKEKAEEEARLAEEEKKQAEAEKYNTGITYEDLARNPAENTGKFVKFTGEILQVMTGDDSNQYRLAIDSDYDKVVLLEIDKSKLLDGNLLENDIVTIEGMFVMEMEYTTVMGAKRTIPAILVENCYRK